MRYLLVLFIVVLPFTSCSKIETYNIEGIDYKVVPVDSSANLLVESNGFSGVIFNEKTKPYSDVFTFRMLVRPTKKENVKAFTPTLEEIIRAENILKSCVSTDQYGADSLFIKAIKASSVQELSNYKRQYFGAINEKGHKLIWINCFHKEDKAFADWETKEVSVQDGGDWFFNIVTNIDTKECYSFIRNSIGG